MGGYGLPQHLRITIGTGEEMRDRRRGARRIHGRQHERPAVRPRRADRHRADRLVAGAGAAARLARRTEIVACARRAETLDAVRRARHRRRDDRRSGRRRRAAPISSCSRRRSAPMPRSAAQIAPALRARRHRHRCRLGQAGGDPRPCGRCCPTGVHFVPGHPVAGTEHSGPESGFAELFHDRWCILTPPPGTDARGGRQGRRALWERAGMRVETMAPDHHDRVLAITSHLPHLIAYTIVGTATDLERGPAIRGDQLSPPAASATSPASPPPTR